MTIYDRIKPSLFPFTSFSQEYPPSQDNGENFKRTIKLQRGEKTTATEERPAEVMPGEKGEGVQQNFCTQKGMEQRS